MIASLVSARAGAEEIRSLRTRSMSCRRFVSSGRPRIMMYWVGTGEVNVTWSAARVLSRSSGSKLWWSSMMQVAPM